MTGMDSGSHTQNNSLERMVSSGLFSKEMMLAFIKECPFGVAIYDRHMVYLACSDQHLADFGLSEAQIIGKNHYEVFPEIPQKWRDAHQRTLRGIVEKKDNDSFVRPDGSIYYSSWKSIPWHDNEGNIGGIIIFSNIITKQLKALEKAMEQEEQQRKQLETVLANIDKGVAALDSKRNLVHANNALAKILGYKDTTEIPADASFLENSFCLYSYPSRTEIPHKDRPLERLWRGEAIAKEIHILHHIDTGRERIIEYYGTQIRNSQGHIELRILILSDITERLHNEETLRLKDKLLQEIGSLAKIGAWEFDVATGIATSTDEMARICDLDSLGDVTVEAGLSFYHGENREKIEKALSKAIDHGIPYDLELEIVSAKGIHKWVSVIGRPVIKDNCVIQVQGSIQDITDSKNVEIKLRESEKLFRSLINTVPDLIWLKNPEGVFLLCNQMFERLLGAKEADIVGKTDYDFVDKEIADFFLENDRKAMESGKPRSNEEWVTFRDDGHRALLYTTKMPMYATDGTLIGTLSTGRDITDIKQAELRLKESEAKYRAIIEGAPLGIQIVKPGGVTLDANQAIAAMLGYELKEFLGINMRDIIHPDDLKHEKQLLMDLVAGKAEWYSREKRYKHKDGHYIWVSTTISTVHNAGGSDVLLFGFAEDIRARKKLEAEREQLISDLQEALEEIKELKGILPICSVCHKIRDDEGYWQKIDKYIMERTDAKFSHSYCPECYQKELEQLSKE